MRLKILSILFLLAFVLPSVTNYFLYQVERNISFRQFNSSKEFTSSDHIRTIVFSDGKTIQWEKRNKEFLLDGNLYDVVSIKRKGMAMEIRCIPDAKEDKIVESYLKCCEKSKNKNNKASIPAVKDKLCIHDEFTKPVAEILYTNIEIILNHPTPLSPWIEIFSPPPEPYSSLSVS